MQRKEGSLLEKAAFELNIDVSVVIGGECREEKPRRGMPCAKAGM